MTAKEERVLFWLEKDRHNPEARKFYNDLFQLYSDEFGVAWLLKELKEARDEVTNVPRARIGSAVRMLFTARDNNTRVASMAGWIGTRQVQGWEFALYAKGLYWMAGYDLLNN
jgi:hypothetical protein